MITAALALSLLALSHTVPNADAGPADTAGAEQGRANTGLFAFEIIDSGTGEAMPGRLTFVGETDDGDPVFTNFAARPEDLALRDRVLYSLSGRATITLPAGTYEVIASRGIEWSTSSVRFTMRPGRSVAWAANLAREVDTTGWASGDFHLHTLTHSGHGDSNMLERIISLIGEGVELAVATDHNHHTDYRPTIDELDAHGHLTPVVGNEVSVPIGHFNAFPLEPGRVVPSHFDDATALFPVLRAEPNAEGIAPVIQVNHPRWEGIDYFNIAGLDAITGVPSRGTWSDDFDTLEILNENTGWGYHEPVVEGVPTGSETHSVLADWFNLLNLGRRHFAVGNSDSHTVAYAFAGYPRNYVATDDADPAALDMTAYAEGIKRGRMFTTTGPFLEFTVNGAAMGETASADDGRATASIVVRAASWIDADRVRLVVNGTDLAQLDIPDRRDGETGRRLVERLETTHELALAHDAWIVALVEGDDSMAPIVDGGGRPVRPIAISNPVWIDADGDGAWTSPAEHAASAMAAAGTEAEAIEAMARLDRRTRGLAVLAAAQTERPFAAALVRQVLGSRGTYRNERLLALRAAEALADPALTDAVETALASAESDPAVQIAALRALATGAPAAASTKLVAFLATDARRTMPSAWLSELLERTPGVVARDWMVLGYFDAPEQGTIAKLRFGPVADGDTSRAWTGKAGEIRWQTRRASDAGYLDLRGLAPDAALQENAAAAAQCWVWVPTAREVVVALGTDDGCRVELNGADVYENSERKGADPAEFVGAWAMTEGWNRVLFVVENGSGGFGARFRVLDAEARIRATPE